MGYIHDEQTEHYKRILREILDTLEGGDISLDFEDKPSAATTIRIIANIAGTALRGVEATEKLMEELAIVQRDDAMSRIFVAKRNEEKELRK